MPEDYLNAIKRHTVASGGMRSVGVAGKEPGWVDWCRLKEDYEGS